jgi:RNA 2',3'-cyclic 3'-phosphodiesterase
VASRPAPVRLFFALWPDPQVRTALSRLAQEVAREGQGRAPRDSNLHLTLAFIGEVPQARIEALLEVGQRVAAVASPFLLTLDRLGGRAHGIAWLAPPSLPEALHHLQAALTDSLAATGFSLQQRVFRPHVTLARDCARPAHRGRVTPIGWEVGRLSLVASTLAAGGSEYRNVGEWPLAANQSTGIV